MPASAAAAAKPGNDRLTSGPSASLVTVNGTSSVPKNDASTVAAAALNVLWPLTYSGNGGVGRSGDQIGSASAAVTATSSAWRIAVIGRHTS